MLSVSVPFAGLRSSRTKDQVRQQNVACCLERRPCWLQNIRLRNPPVAMHYVREMSVTAGGSFNFEWSHPAVCVYMKQENILRQTQQLDKYIRISL
jgi:hypothetical protein